MLKPEQVPDEITKLILKKYPILDNSGWTLKLMIIDIINAWPGMEVVDWYHADNSIILPLPATENGDA